MELLGIIGEFILAVLKGVLISPVAAIMFIFIIVSFLACCALVFLIFSCIFFGPDHPVFKSDPNYYCKNNCWCKAFKRK